jgi:hypothetical protein
MLIWYIFPVLISCTKKNLATLDWIMGIIKRDYVNLNAPGLSPEEDLDGHGEVVVVRLVLFGRGGLGQPRHLEIGAKH